MAGVQDHELAIAVSAAGGLGSIPCAAVSTEAAEGQVAAFRAATDGALNLNFFCHREPVPDPARESAWMAALAPYYAELGATPAPPSPGGRRPFDADAAALVEQVRPAVVSFHFGLPSPALLGRVKAAGSTVLASATTVEEAVLLETDGADVVIAQGAEAGGHRGMFLTLDLETQPPTDQLVRTVLEHVRLPVVAAGGIATRADVERVFALGAEGVQPGTVYLLCPETRTSEIHRAAIEGAKAGSTVLTNVLTGRPARGIVNRAMRELGPISPLAPAFPLAAVPIAPLRAAAEARGLGDFSTLWAGERVHLCERLPAGTVTRRLGARA